MKEGLIRSAKLLGLFLVSSSVLVIAELLVPMDREDAHRHYLLSVVRELASPEGESTGSASVQVAGAGGAELFPLILPSGRSDGAVVIVSVPGYRSLLRIGYRFDEQLNVLGMRVIRADEDVSVNRFLRSLENGEGIDGMSGATITREAVQRGERLAYRHLQAFQAEAQ